MQFTSTFHYRSSTPSKQHKNAEKIFILLRNQSNNQPSKYKKVAMKNLICFLILTLGILGCSSDEDKSAKKFEFTTEYTTEITVGGVVGVRNRTFKIGETFKGVDKGKETIKIRIAEHSQLNDNCPNSMCYQEFLEVPRAYLKLTK